MFAELVGNTDTKTRLSHCLATNTFAHAYLIEGAAGSGKRTLVRAVLTALAQGEHPDAAAKVASWSSPDIHVVMPESGRALITVEQIRTLLRDMIVVPNDLSFHAAVICAADAMNANAQNALLKQLEEPRNGIFFFLLAENAATLLPTIRSRVQRIRMERLSDEDIVAYLSRHVPQARTLLNDAQVRDRLLRRANGNLGTAISLCHSQGGAEEKHRALVQELFSLYGNGQNADLYCRITKLSAKKREELYPVFASLAAGLRDLLAVKRGASVPLLFFESHAEVASIVPRLTAQRLMDSARAVSNAEAACRANGNIALLLTVLANNLVGTHTK